VEDNSESAPDFRPKRMRVEMPAGAALPGLAALTALMLLCSVILAKTLAYMVDSLEIPQIVAATQALPPTLPVPPLHRRALSDKFLRKGVDEMATGSVSPRPERK